MSRILKRVPLDFDWPIDKTWEGFIFPESLNGLPCETCHGSGDSPEARHLHNQWYGYNPITPAKPFTVLTPAVRAFAERNCKSSPEYYGSGEQALIREATRLLGHWNGMLMHHIDQQDVDALIAAGRLLQFTHNWNAEYRRYEPKDPIPFVSAEEVNEWGLQSLGHDAINAGVVINARCERNGWEYLCSVCEGHGSTEAYPGQRAEAEAWRGTEPPTGPGWQVWEGVSEGSPQTPVFSDPEVLIGYLATTGIWGKKWNRDVARKFVLESGWADSAGQVF